MKSAATAFMICTLFTGLTSKEGIFMRYSYEYKRKCVELYREGKWPETPEGITNTKGFHRAENEYIKAEIEVIKKRSP